MKSQSRVLQVPNLGLIGNPVQIRSGPAAVSPSKGKLVYQPLSLQVEMGRPSLWGEPEDLPGDGLTFL